MFTPRKSLTSPLTVIFNPTFLISLMDLSTSSFGGAASIESSVKNEEESGKSNLAIIDNGQTAKFSAINSRPQNA